MRFPSGSGGNKNTRRPGRNEPCPCGSRKKFKRCHGTPAGQTAEQLQQEQQLRLLHDEQKLRLLQAAEARRAKQQGFTVPFVTLESNSYRKKNNGLTMHWSKTWK